MSTVPPSTLEAWQHAVGTHAVPDALWDFLDVVSHELTGVTPETSLSSTVTVRGATTTISLWGRAWPQAWQKAIGQLVVSLSEDFPLELARQLKFQLSDTRRGVVFGPAVTLGTDLPRMAFAVRGRDGEDENRVSLAHIRAMVDQPGMPLGWPADLDSEGEASGWRLDMAAGGEVALTIELPPEDDGAYRSLRIDQTGVHALRWVPTPSWDTVRALLGDTHPAWLRLAAVPALQPLRMTDGTDEPWLELAPTE